MPILYMQTSQVGLVGSLPSLAYIQTSDTEAQVLATGYLNKAVQSGLASFSLPCLANVSTIASVGAAPVAGWYNVSHSAGNWSLTDTSDPGHVVLPTVANALAVFSDTAGTLTDNIAANNVVATSSATPGTIRSIKGAMQGTATTMTSGNLVGVRGEVDCVGASGGFLYGVQGKVIPTGTLSGSSWTAGLFGQFDISAATVNAGQTAALWGDYGATSGTITSATGMRGVAMTNTTAAVLNAQDYRYGNATYLLELAGAGGTLNYYAAAGTGSGSAGNSTHCAAQQVIKIEINGVAAYIPVFTQNT